jgi:hypothetical protein
MEQVELLSNYHLLPKRIQDILLGFDEDENGLYLESQRVINLLEQNGYTADYDLSGGLFDLHKKDLVKLESVGSLYDPDNRIAYPMQEDGKPDVENGTFLSDCDEEWFDNLSKEDREQFKPVRCITNIDQELVFKSASEEEFIEFARVIAKENEDDPDDIQEYHIASSFPIKDMASAEYYLVEYNPNLEVVTDTYSA